MCFRIIFFSFVLLLSSCNKVTNLSKTQLIGHAGNGMSQWNGMFTSNSMESIQYALSLDNCAGVEIDVRLSKDTTLWLLHGADLSSLTNGSGSITNATDSYLSTLHYKSLHREKLVKLSDVLRANFGKRIIVDFKNYDPLLQTTLDFNLLRKGLEKLSEYLPHITLKINTFSIYPYIKDLCPHIVLELNNVSEITPSIKNSELEGFMFKASNISKEEIVNLQTNGYFIYLYEVRSVSRLKKELKKQADFILVDDLLNSVLEK